MADRLLEAVIQLENQIQQQLQHEQTMATVWLEQVRAEQDAELQRADRDLAAENELAITAARQCAEAEADALIAHEIDYCTRLEEISDEILLEVLRRQLVPRLVDHSG